MIHTSIKHPTFVCHLLKENYDFNDFLKGLILREKNNITLAKKIDSCKHKTPYFCLLFIEGKLISFKDRYYGKNRYKTLVKKM